MRFSAAKCVLLVLFPAFGCVGAEYVGVAICASCHAVEARQQNATGHAVALRRAGDHPLSGSFVRGGLQIRAPGFQFQFRKGFTVRVADKTAYVDVPLEWAFGAGTQAVTFVSRVDTMHYVELYFSYYRALEGWGPTPGQQALHPAGLGEAVGLYYKTRDPATGIDGCFACHSTGPLQFDASNAILPHEPGVRCESCHGPGGLHVAAALRGEPSAKLIGNPARLSAAKQLDFCGGCHRMPTPSGKPADFSFAWNVRHQPVYLSKSECFRKSNGALTCLTCHSPHEGLEKTVPVSNSHCNSCHEKKSASCKENCVDCHMPRVSPQSPLRFSNHWIGVYDTAAKLAPLR